MATSGANPTDRIPPPPAAPTPVPAGGGDPPPKGRGRPAFGKVVVALVGFRLLREVAVRVGASEWGLLGALAVPAVGLALVLGWRWDQRRRVRARGGVEHTPEAVAQQLADSGLLPPAFAEDGTLAGASILVLNQLPKVLEVETQYEVFGSDATRLGTLRQIGQTRGKQVARLLTAFDQLFTHHFELEDVDGRDVLRMTRPRKLFRSRLQVFDGDDRYLGTWHQENIFWKIRFVLVDAAGQTVARLRAENLRAWDFQVEADGHDVATVLKSWEGWGRTAFTRADRYVVRVNRPVPRDLRLLLLTTPLLIDVALKQDARGLG